MKATKLLIRQHDEMRALFKTLEGSNGHTRAVMNKLADTLAAHMVIEQELFYPAVLTVNESLVLEGYEEHAVARFALERLMGAERSDRSFKAKVTTLKELIEAHVKEEEETLFPEAEKAFGHASKALCDKMESLFEKTLKSGHAHILGRGGAARTSAVAPDLHTA